MEINRISPGLREVKS